MYFVVFLHSINVVMLQIKAYEADFKEERKMRHQEKEEYERQITELKKNAADSQRQTDKLFSEVCYILEVEISVTVCKGRTRY